MMHFLDASPQPITTSDSKLKCDSNLVEIKQLPLTCMPPCSKRIILDPCFNKVSVLDSIQSTHSLRWVPLPPSGTQKDWFQVQPLHICQYGLQGQDQGKIKRPWEWFGQGPEVKHTLWEYKTFCKQTRGYPQPTMHCRNKTQPEPLFPYYNSFLTSTKPLFQTRTCWMQWATECTE